MSNEYNTFQAFKNVQTDYQYKGNISIRTEDLVFAKKGGMPEVTIKGKVDTYMALTSQKTAWKDGVEAAGQVVEETVE